MKYTESWIALILTCAWKFLDHFVLNMFLMGCSGVVCSASYNLSSVSLPFLPCFCRVPLVCLDACVCSRWGFPPDRLMVMWGLVPVISRLWAHPRPDQPRSKSHFTWTAFTCCPSNPLILILIIPKLVPGQLLINKVWVKCKRAGHCLTEV